MDESNTWNAKKSEFEAKLQEKKAQEEEKDRLSAEYESLVQQINDAESGEAWEQGIGLCSQLLDLIPKISKEEDPFQTKIRGKLRFGLEVKFP